MPVVSDLKKWTALTEVAGEADSSSARDTSRSETDSRDSSSTASDSDSSVTSDSSKKNKGKNRATRKRKGKKVVSGKVEVIDEMDIVRPVKYPHARLNPDFVKDRKFDNLPFHHLVAGELEIVTGRKCGVEERMARLGVLKYLAYHFAYLDTAEIRDQYDGIMKRVERGELEWSDNLPKRVHKSLKFRREFMNAERRVTEKETRAGDTLKEKKVKSEKRKENKEEVFYCADYNRGKCSFDTSHLGKWAGRDIMKLHICKRCLAEEGQKRAHPETDDACPVAKRT